MSSLRLLPLLFAFVRNKLNQEVSRKRVKKDQKKVSHDKDRHGTTAIGLLQE